MFISGFASTNAIWQDQIDKFDKDSIIVAWSMGCFDAVHNYLESPDKFKRLVLVSGTPKFLREETYTQGTSKALFRNLEKKVISNKELGIRYFYSLIGEFPILDQMPKFKLDEILKSLERLKTEDIRKLLPKLDIPVLLIHGDIDPICKVEASKYMAELIPGSQLVVFEGVGHAPFLEQPERFSEIVGEFLS